VKKGDMLMGFLEVITPIDAHQIIEDSIDHLSLRSIEKIEVTQSLDRVTANEVLAPEDLPAFTRSVMDGYALKAEDAFGVSEDKPKSLKIIGSVEMGIKPEMEVKNGEAVKIPTGGMLPLGADGVIMVEDTDFKDDKVKIYNSISPGENIVERGSDVEAGQVVLAEGHKLRSQDIGALAGLGIEEIDVYEKPKVGIISTGDELLPLGEELEPGEIRDINSYSLSSLVSESGGTSISSEIIEDNAESLKSAIERMAPRVDFLLISGGSSVGTKDLTYEVVDELSSEGVLIHGIAVKPGKPTIFAKIDDVAVYGLPGHPVSAMIVFKKFVAPYLKKRIGVNDIPHKIIAEFDQNVSSAPGREDYLRVKLEKREEGFIAKPVRGESSLIMTMVEADGLVKIPLFKEGLSKEEVEVELF
jgi:molybdopterin molybdotransferase